ncbi:MAG: hypothetical protein Q6361_06035 [Candidatus Hermodarchaeota archaeon]|nr:hypothetical protein [Candidatus Hermodarchaeota archaeon]
MGSTHYTWSRTFGEALFDEGTAVVETSDGDFVMMGTTSNFGAGHVDM